MNLLNYESFHLKNWVSFTKPLTDFNYKVLSWMPLSEQDQIRGRQTTREAPAFK